MSPVEFLVLGPLEVRESGRSLPVGGAKQRGLLALLLLHANEVVAADRLVDELWGGRPPATAAKALQVYVSQLRKLLEPARTSGEAGRVLVTRSGGYELVVDPEQIDLHRFERLLSEGRETLAAGDPATARGLLSDALALWRGSPLVDFRYEPFAQAEIARLEELRLAALEQRIEADLALARDAEVVAQLERLVAEHPLRERLRGQLMLALYRSGRQSEALDVYQDGRRHLSDTLGLEPGAALKQLERAILAQDRSLLPEGAAPPVADDRLPRVEPSPEPLPTATREMRKTVTVLHWDVLPSGRQLDPESTRDMTAQGLGELLPVLERHGATVDRSIGGAVTAIFGIPVVFEDDALRAVRAAAEMRDRLEELRNGLTDRFGAWLELRAGVGTGEVVVGGNASELYATGDPVDRAVRLQQEARPGEILIGEATLRLAQHAVEVEPEGDRARLLSALPAAELGRRSRFESAMVGRARERARLHDALEQATSHRSCQLFTILGAPGVGKSRLVREFVRELPEEALVARGRCLPYGEGITYWPVVEIIRDLARLDAAESSEASLGKIAALLEGEEKGELIARLLTEVIGLTEQLSGAEESFWAVRTMLEAVARHRPLVVVLDDIHWGEPTFLDLVDHVADWAQDANVLLVCIARPELLDARPDWGGGKLNATSILLEPLSLDESAELVEALAGPATLDDAAKRRIVEAADGNPLFVEELLALLTDDARAGAAVEVPPTIQALLAARLDRLGDDERAVIEAAAVEGKIFHQGSVEELLELPAVAIGGSLMILVRKDLVRSGRAEFPGERAFRFRHLLIRDAAYESLPKRRRAVLHERHARWLEREAGERGLEFEEILGYHLEQAYRYRAELGTVDEHAQKLALDAGQRLALAGRRALARGDGPAAVKLLARGASLLPASDPQRVHLVPGFRAIQGLGDELRWTDEVLNASIGGGDRRLRTHALVQQALLGLFTQSEVDVDGLVQTATRAIGDFEELEDELGLARAWRLLQQARYLARDSGASADAAEQGLEHARRAGDPLEELEIVDWLGIALFLGSTPAPEAIRRIEAHLARGVGSRAVESGLYACLAGLKAMGGDFADARELLARAHSVVGGLGYIPKPATVPFYEGVTERLVGDAGAAERVLRSSLRPLEEIGETSTYCSIVAELAHAVYDQGRYEEAEELTRISERHVHLNDVHAHSTWRPARAKILARRGELEPAESLAREALAFAAQSDFLNAHGNALIDLAVVLELAGRPQDGVAAVEQAIGLYEQKGNVVSAARARDQLARLTEAGDRSRARAG